MKRESGFTLLETLVAMVLMSLLLMALFGGFRAGINSWRLADSHVERNEPQLLLSRMLYRQMNQLKFSRTARESFRAALWESEKQGVFYLATADVLQYIAPLGLAVGEQHYLIELHNRPGGEPGIWFKAVPYDEQNKTESLDSFEEAGLELLSSEVELRFSYFMGGEWADELESGARPLLVKVDWRAEGRTWPSSIYRISGG